MRTEALTSVCGGEHGEEGEIGHEQPSMGG